MSDMNLSLIVRLIDQFTQPAKQLRDGVGKVAGDIRDGFSDAISTGLSADRMDAAISQAETQLGKAKGRLVGAIGTGLALFAPVKVAADFETAMNQVSAVSGAVGAEFDALQAQALDLGRKTQFSTSEVADAMGFLAMAGFKANDIIAAMPATLQLAASAQLDMGRAADIVTNILTGYGKEVTDLAHVNDVLVKAFTSSNTDLVQLSEAMKYAGPVASAAGVNFEETAAALGMMGNAGIQASMAGTSLRGAISRSLVPTKQMQAAMTKAGLSFTDAHGKLLPLADIIEQLEPHADDAGLFMQLFGQRAGPAMAALVSQGSDALRDLTGELQDSGGTAERIASVQMKGFNGLWKEITSAMEGAAIAIGTLLIPAISDIARQITPVINGLTDWSAANPELARNILMVVASMMALSVATRLITFAFASARVSALGLTNTFLRFDDAGKNISVGWRLLAGAGSLLSGAFSVVVWAAGALVTGLGAISAPVWAVIAAVVAAGFVIWKFWDRITSFLSGMASGIGELLGPAVALIGDAIDGLIGKIGELFGLDAGQMEEFKAAAGDALGALFNFGPMIDGAKQMFAAFWDWLGGVFTQETLTDEQKAEMNEAGKRLILDMWDGIRSMFSNVLEWFSTLPQQIAAAIGSIDIGSLIQWPEPPEWLSWMFGGGGPKPPTPPPGGGPDIPPLDPPGGGGWNPMDWGKQQDVQATIAASVTDNRPPTVNVNLTQNITGVSDPVSAGNTASARLASAVNQARTSALHDGMD